MGHRLDVTAQDTHRLVTVVRDHIGVIVVCTCRRWGYAGPSEDAARQQHANHVEDAR